MTLLQPKNLFELDHIHKELEGLFHEHQLAVLQGGFRQAEIYLKAYTSALLNHIKEEDEILLPLYKERAMNIRGGHPEILIGEHQRIIEWISQLKLRLNRVIRTPVDERLVIALLDDEAHYKIFLAHHCLREERIFYPEVDRVVTANEKLSLLKLLNFSLQSNSTKA